MKKFNIFFTLKGIGGIVEAPNTGNPVMAKDMSDCLRQLADFTPKFGFGVVVIGVRVEQIDAQV